MFTVEYVINTFCMLLKKERQIFCFVKWMNTIVVIESKDFAISISENLLGFFTNGMCAVYHTLVNYKNSSVLIVSVQSEIVCDSNYIKIIVE